MPSLFTKIINGEIPSIKVHEDSRTLAIMDIYPIQRGQILIFPKLEISTVWDMPTEDYRALMDAVQEAGQKIQKVFPEKARVGVVIEGMQITDHAHVKVFPFSTISEFHHIPDPSDAPSQEDLEQLAQQLHF